LQTIKASSMGRTPLKMVFGLQMLRLARCHIVQKVVIYTGIRAHYLYLSYNKRD